MPPLEAIIISILTAVFFIGMVVLVVVNWRKVRWPPKSRCVNVERGPLSVRTFVSNDVVLGPNQYHQELAEVCADAVEITIATWDLIKHELFSKKYNRGIVAISIMSDARFDDSLHNKPWAKHYAAYCWHLPAFVGGSGVPCLYIRSRYIDLIIKTGEPVIHELLHILSGIEGHKDDHHADPEVWEHSVTPDTRKRNVQLVAREEFKVRYGKQTRDFESETSGNQASQN